MKNPRHILITGASSGIGAALALYYARPGMLLSLSGRDEARLQDVAESCRAAGAAVSTVLADVTDETAMRAWIGATDDAQALDLVIANAGISGGTGGLGMGEPASQAQRIFAVNLSGALNTIHPAIERMQARKAGQVALISSLASFNGWPGAPAYSASKGAVRLYGEALRGALAAQGIGVSVVCPGFIVTPMTDVNPYPMPFLMTAEKAAGIIGRGLARGQARIAFPWPTYAMALLFSLLPPALGARFLSQLPEKPGKI